MIEVWLVVPVYIIAVAELVLVVSLKLQAVRLERRIDEIAEGMPDDIIEGINDELAGGIVGVGGTVLREVIEQWQTSRKEAALKKKSEQGEPSEQTAQKGKQGGKDSKAKASTSQPDGAQAVAAST